MKKLTIALSLFILQASFFTLSAQTTILGPTVSGHWTLAGSPYNIQNSVYIPNDSTLTIDPGVTVDFQTSFTPYMHVLGRLLAVGTPSDTIYFTATDTTNGFHGIKFYGILPTNDTSKLEYCKIQYGKSNGSNFYVQAGGALLFENWSKAIVSHCYISNCQAETSYGFGAAICCDSGSSPVITYNTITKCISSFYGGGIYAGNNSTPVIAYDTIIGNSADYGGAIVMEYVKNYDINNNTLEYNSGFNGGGGIFMSSSKGTISHNTIEYNTVGYGPGGGIYDANGDSLYILNNTIAYNWLFYPTVGGGGILCQSTNMAMIDYNIIADNYSGTTNVNGNGGNGGGIYLLQAPSVIISNNSIINNEAVYTGGYGNGGGIYCNNTSPLIINTTIANNYANQGGGLYCDLASYPISRNCIYWGDTGAASGNEIFQNDQASTPNYYYCDVQGGQAAFGLNGNFYYGAYFNNINSAPDFVSPSGGKGSGYNGLSANWALQNGSPCIDTGDPLYNAYPSSDLAGNPRVVICRADIGAYENQYGISAPLQLFLSGPNSICPGDSALLSVSGASSYSWNPSTGLSATNIANPVAKPSVNTTYTVIGTSGVCEAIDTITIFLKALPVITFSGNDSTCKGTPSTITASGGGAYLWSNSSTSSSISVNPSSTTVYTVSVTINGCTSDSTFMLTVNKLPTVSISDNLDTLKASGAKTYVWSTGSTYDTTIVSQQGYYYVTGTDSNGCVSKDSIYSLLTNSTTIKNNSGVAIYPVPSNGNITVMLTGKGYQSLKIVDELGRSIYSDLLDKNKQSQNMQIDLGNVPSGVYTMQIISENGTINKQIVIQK
ncbi:MAG TPA: right-handed parallel beta-helix repeat-containing protein [Bacteroidia bacterium]|nr:right-handed parallel beta-helix repeat-containing protein [Bacteroidia bacterium]